MKEVTRIYNDYQVHYVDNSNNLDYSDIDESSIYYKLVPNNQQQSKNRLLKGNKKMDYKMLNIHNIIKKDDVENSFFQRELSNIFLPNVNLVMANSIREVDQWLIHQQSKFSIRERNIAIGINNKCLIDNIASFNDYILFNDMLTSNNEVFNDVQLNNNLNKAYLFGRNVLELSNVLNNDMIQIYLSEIYEECLIKSSSHFLLVKYCFQHEKAQDLYKVITKNEIHNPIEMNLSDSPITKGIAMITVVIEGMQTIIIPLLFKDCFNDLVGSRKKRNCRIHYKQRQCELFHQDLNIRQVQVMFINKKNNKKQAKDSILNSNSKDKNYVITSSNI